jgi:nicotinamidase/pyrazinamidase
MMCKPTDTKVTPRRGDALVIVDVQKDFLPGGALAVPEGGSIVPALNRYLAIFVAKDLPIYATRNWHPPRHCSFREQGGPWPPHCIADSDGAQFADGLELPPSSSVISKATRREADAYSDFEGTDFEEVLRSRGVGRLWVGGLATDYCVLHTVRDALSCRFEVLLLRDAIRALDVESGDGRRAEEEMIHLGAAATRWECVSP